MPPKFDPS
ncbi:hypothetical protein LINPERPRIM_LOCUS13461 [Linum perenne]